jgi:hypothetical protein
MKIMFALVFCMLLFVHLVLPTLKNLDTSTVYSQRDFVRESATLPDFPYTIPSLSSV